MVICRMLTTIGLLRFRLLCLSFWKVLATASVFSSSEIEKYQFGFKSEHSTGICTDVFKQTVDYYVNRGSHVFACFIDFKKAFDYVNYWKLFTKLLQDNIDSNVVCM